MPFTLIVETRTNMSLKDIEAEAIHIFREVAAEAHNPFFRYSVGKDSAVMLHLALKAFLSGKPHFQIPACGHHVEIPRYDHVPRPESR